MKYVVISRLAPGVDSARKAFEVFMKAGLPAGTESVWAGADGKRSSTLSRVRPRTLWPPPRTHRSSRNRPSSLL